MADNTTISVGWKIEDAGDGFKRITMSAEDLKKILQSTVVESEKLQHNLINFTALATGLDSIGNTLDSLKSVVDDYASAYDTQLEVETQLAQVMRTTMDAREEDIQSIKDFCSAQQEIGIVGDEVQLAGAQELATYLELKSSLKSVIPVMNDMLAQQYGLAASGENAAQIASMLGKVLQGQTGALSRYGYKFDEAQEKILKYGTESQRVAVLCDVVSESVGGMNAKLAQTDSGRMKQLDNNLGDVKEVLGGVAKRIQPILTIGANATMATAGVMKLASGLKTLVNVLKLTNSATGWIGLALTVVASIVGWLVVKNNEAADSFDRLTDAEERAARAAEMAADLTEAENDARKAATSSLELNIAKLKNFNGTKAEEKKLVKEMNDTYGQTMGYFKSVSEWYNTLIKNSKAYAEQMINEAKARKYADQIAELEIKRDAIAYNEDGSAKLYSKKAKRTEERVVSKEEAEKYEKEGYSVTGRHYGGKYQYWAQIPVYSTSDHAVAQAAVDDLNAQIAHKRGKVEGLTKNKVEMPVMGDTKVPELTDKHTTRLQEINRLLTKYQEQYVTADEKTRAAIRVKVDALNKEKDAIELAKAELERPLKLETIDDYNKEITYLEKLRKVASAEEIAAIDEQLTHRRQELTVLELTGREELKTAEDYEKRLNQLSELKRTATAEEAAQIQTVIDKTEQEYEVFKRSSHTRLTADKIESYKQLEDEIAFCNELLRVGTDEERRWATENLPLLRKKERAMSAAMSAVGVAETPDEASNLEELSAAISLIDDKIQRASADEIDALERSKMAFEEKKRAYERGIRIPEMQKEVADLGKLSDRELKIKVKSMGFDALRDKLREIQKELDDIDNPPTEGQRKALEELRSVYAGWLKETTSGFDAFQDGWNGVKGIGSGVESLTGLLDDNANAWSVLTGLVDGFIQIYNGISSVVAILETIKTLSEATTVTKTAEAAATSSATTATAVEAAAAGTAATAQIPVIAANKGATASFVELAAAQYMAAHAAIPFAGFGIGAGFAEAAAETVRAIGVMPFADGGVVYGPTLGLVGEYAGASSNPEVIAPLDKLKDIIGTQGGGAPVIIGGRLEVSGRKLAVVLENQTKISGMSGKRNQF